MLEPHNKTFTIVTAPYFQSKLVVCATNIEGVDVACNPKDLYLYADSRTLQNFFELVRNSFIRPVISTVEQQSSLAKVGFSVVNGVCTIHCSNGERYSAQFVFEKGVKLNEQIVLQYQFSTNCYTVRTISSVRRENTLKNKECTSYSYERIRRCLEHNKCTTPEIAQTLGVPENRISGRLSEMCKCGIVHKCGFKTVDGRKQTLWVLDQKSHSKKFKLDDYYD